MIAHDAPKPVHLETDPSGLNVRQDHWTQTFGAGVGLNCYEACVEQDCKEWHDAHLNSGGNAIELSVTDGCRDDNRVTVKA